MESAYTQLLPKCLNMTILNRTSFIQRTAKTMAHNICLYKGRDISGQNAWYFLLLSNSKKEILRKDYNRKINLSDYGKIIASGYGKDVPEKVMHMMNEKYNYRL